MHRWSDLRDVPEDFGPTVVTLGNFDGVHRGHHAVLHRVVQRARANGLQAVAITFEPHPLAVLFPERAPDPLSTPRHRLDLLAGEGLDAVLVMPFTRELSQWSPRRFVEDVLVDMLHARVVVVGGDTRFGHRNAGDVGTLRALGAELEFDVDVMSDLGRVDGPQQPERRWSSTWVRELVAAGDVDAAAEVLGRPHRVTGEVVHGDHRGRELGYPTANLSPDAVGAVPADGIYAGWLVRIDRGGERMPAAISVGTNPTFDGVRRRVEAYVLDRDDLDLYGEVVACEFVDRLRPTVRFSGVDELVAQMARDVEQTRTVLGLPAAERTPRG